MAHELTHRKNGFVEFAFSERDGQGWHRLGQEVAAADVHNLAVWAAKSGMDWKIARSRVRFGEGAAQQTWDAQHVLFRTDTKQPLGVVSESYKIVQPSQVLQFFRDTAEMNGFELSAAGTLFGGKRFWATARMDIAAPVSSADTIRQYLLLSTSCDGSLATEARITTTRTVCNNTLTAARAEGAKNAVRVSHRSTFDEAEVKLDLAAANAQWAQFCNQMRTLANKTVRNDEAQQFIARLLAGAAASQEKEDKARETPAFKRMMYLVDGGQSGADLPGVRGTAYGVLQAVTEYADHFTRASTGEHRFFNAMWGGAARLKDTAFEQLLTMSILGQKQTAAGGSKEFAALLSK